LKFLCVLLGIGLEHLRIWQGGLGLTPTMDTRVSLHQFSTGFFLSCPSTRGVSKSKAGLTSMGSHWVWLMDLAVRHTSADSVTPWAGHRGVT
jgi:hypothetical protein